MYTWTSPGCILFIIRAFPESGHYSGHLYPDVWVPTLFYLRVYSVTISTDSSPHVVTCVLQLLLTSVTQNELFLVLRVHRLSTVS